MPKAKNNCKEILPGMKDLFYKELVNFGLSEKEAKIYIALLEMEIATVFEVAKHAGINRSSAYVVLEGLKKKGLVGISEDKKVRHYIASTPEILLHSATAKAKKHEDIKTGIESIIPELKALHKDTKHKPIVKVFEGKEGIINSFEDTLFSKEKKIRVVSSVGKFSQLLVNYIPGYVQRRIKKGIRMYGIHPDTEFERYLQKIDKFDEAILIPEKNYRARADMAIYDDKIGYMTSENGGLSVSIEHKEMAEVMKSVFDLAYEEAKRLNKELK